MKVKKTLVMMLLPMLMWSLLFAGVARGQTTFYLDTTTVSLTDPVSSSWHELYPVYSRMYHMSSWIDTNGDGKLSASDQVDLKDEAGVIRWYHVDAVTTTIFWTFKAPDTGDGAVEPETPTLQLPTNPVDSRWHQIFPVFSRWFTITSWQDSNGDGRFSPSDQFDFKYDGETTIRWAHLDRVSTDIIVTEKPIVPEFALATLMQIALIAAIAYLGFKKLAIKPFKHTN